MLGEPGHITKEAMKHIKLPANEQSETTASLHDKLTAKSLRTPFFLNKD